jgi:hypothetical protein
MRLGPTESWTRDQKRRDLTDSIYGHQEHARFLEFVRRHLKRRHVYRLSLRDLGDLEITPKCRYL